MLNSFLKKSIPLVLIACTILGCGFSESIEESNEMIENFFKDRINNGNTGSEKFYSDHFLSQVDSSEWNRIVNLVSKANGNIVSYEMVSWNIKKRADTKTNQSGTFVYYQFKTTYENGEGVETITVVKNKENPDYKIISHNYNSKMIQELVNQGIDTITESDS